MKRLFLLLAIVFIQNSCSMHKNAMPDFCQVDKAYGYLPGDGKAYCGPVAASNILIYLDKNGFNNIVKKNDLQGQYELISLLGSANYMNTSLKKGTELIDIMKGLEKYLQERGYKTTLDWKGWNVWGPYDETKVPTKQWIFNKVNKGNNVILQVGWYKFIPEENLYKRISGHYVSLVEVRDNSTIVIHDPSVRSGLKPEDEYCKLSAIQKGVLSSWKNHPKRNAENYVLLDGIKIKKGANTAIIDGAISLKLSQ